MYLTLKCNFYGKHKGMNALSIICFLRLCYFIAIEIEKKLHQTPLLYLIWDNIQNNHAIAVKSLSLM